MNFCKRSYQPIFRYLYTEVKKRRGEISLHEHFKNRKRLVALLIVASIVDLVPRLLWSQLDGVLL